MGKELQHGANRSYSRVNEPHWVYPGNICIQSLFVAAIILGLNTGCPHIGLSAKIKVFGVLTAH